MKISEVKYDGIKVIVCKLDEQEVIYCDKKRYNLKQWWRVTSRAISGGLVGDAFFPVFGGFGGAVTGLVSAFWNDVNEVGYYTPDKNLHCKGTIYLRDAGQYELFT